MKIFFLSIFCFLGICSANAQIVNIDTVKSTFNYKPAKKITGESDYMYSVGLRLLSVQQMPRLLKQVNSADLYNSYLSGLVLKINDNQISYRMVADFYNKNHSFINECADCEITTGKLTDYSLGIGFEKKLTYSRLQPYFGMDIGFRRNKFKGESHNATTVNFTTPYDVVSQKNGFEFTPAVGFKFNLTNQFTLAAESAFGLLYSYETQEKMYKDAARTRTFQKYNKWEFLLKPLNILSLQYNLGSIN